MGWGGWVVGEGTEGCIFQAGIWNPTRASRSSSAIISACSSVVWQVVEASGWGWDHFDIRTVGTYGELYAIRTLDYENPLHRRGFKFMVQVTDRVSIS